jgi:hypothetical protein
MMPPLGSWCSVRSTIPNYHPGTEWLHFNADGTHLWEVGRSDQPRRSMMRFTLEQRGDVLHMRPWRADAQTYGPGWKIAFELCGNQLRVTPEHGHQTVFERRETPG